MLRSVICLSAALLAGQVFAQSAGATGDAVSADAACPAKRMGPPAYPVSAARSGVGGKVVLSLALDRCGRVLDARIARSSGREALDDAALEIAHHWVVGPLDPASHASLVDGRYETPVEFVPPTGSHRIRTPAEIGWPRSHKRPRYRPDLDAVSYRSVSEVMAGVLAGIPEDRTAPPPYAGLPGVFASTGNPDAPEFWMVAYTGAAGTAVRYRPVIDEAGPVVLVSVVCDKGPGACEQDTAFLLKGLPFAKARK